MYSKYTTLRDKAGVTDYGVSKETGISTATLTNWKYGRYNPKVDKLKILADYFGVSIEYFLSEEKEVVQISITQWVYQSLDSQEKRRRWV